MKKRRKKVAVWHVLSHSDIRLYRQKRRGLLTRICVQESWKSMCQLV